MSKGYGRAAGSSRAASTTALSTPFHQHTPSSRLLHFGRGVGQGGHARHDGGQQGQLAQLLGQHGDRRVGWTAAATSAALVAAALALGGLALVGRGAAGLALGVKLVKAWRGEVEWEVGRARP